jgi:hypothetical protein
MVDWLQLLFEFVAVVVGVLLAFWIDRHREEQLNKTKVSEFLELIRDELRQNAATLEGILKQLQDVSQFYLPYYRLRVFAWTSLSSRLTLLKNDGLRRDIIACYYRFDMYERAMSRYLDLVYTIIKQPPNPYDKLENKASEVRNSIATQIQHPKRGDEGMLVFIPKVIQEIDDEIKRLQDC